MAQGNNGGVMAQYSDDLREKRARTVDSLNRTLDKVKPVDAPEWMILLITFPLTFGAILYQTGNAIVTLLAMWAWMVIQAVFLPFRVFYFWLDVCTLTVWFFKVMVIRMRGGR